VPPLHIRLTLIRNGVELGRGIVCVEIRPCGWHYSCRRSLSGRFFPVRDLHAVEGAACPMHLFKNGAWVASCLLLALGARYLFSTSQPFLLLIINSVYYAMPIIWPSMIAVLYTTDSGASMYSGWLNCISGTLIVTGQIIGGVLAVPIGKTKI
jgi:hypothetical protein